MDKQYIKENEVIERYLRNELTDDERQQFRVALLFDKQLQQEVEDTRLLFQQIQQLKPKATLTNNPSKKRPWFWWLIGGLSILSFVTIGYFINKNNPTKTEEKTTIEVPAESLENNKSTKENRMETIDSTINNQPNILPFEPQPKVEKPAKTTQPIAEADTKTHPYLDQFTTGGFRNNDIKITVNSPKMGERLVLENGKINLNIKSVLSINEPIDNQRFIIRLFSNKKVDFDDFKPILSANPKIRKSGNQYQLSFNANIPLSAGLYYFIIEDNDLEDMIYVGKFLVE